MDRLQRGSGSSHVFPPGGNHVRITDCSGSVPAAVSHLELSALPSESPHQLPVLLPGSCPWQAVPWGLASVAPSLPPPSIRHLYLFLSSTPYLENIISDGPVLQAVSFCSSCVSFELRSDLRQRLRTYVCLTSHT